MLLPVLPQNYLVHAVPTDVYTDSYSCKNASVANIHLHTWVCKWNVFVSHIFEGGGGRRK